MEHMLRTTGFATQENVETDDLIQSYYMNIGRYTTLKNRLNKVRVQPTRPVDLESEKDRVYDLELLKAIELSMEEVEEGKIEDQDRSRD